jgi:hypothetical protein
MVSPTAGGGSKRSLPVILVQPDENSWLEVPSLIDRNYNVALLLTNQQANAGIRTTEVMCSERTR